MTGGQLELVVIHDGLASVAPVVSCQSCTCGVDSNPFGSPLTKRSKKRTSWASIAAE